MTRIDLHIHSGGVSGRRLVERVAALGFPVVRIDPDGHAKATAPCSWFERTVIESADLARALRGSMEQFDNKNQALLQPIPGVYLVALPPRYTEPNDLTPPVETRYAAFMLGQEFIDGEALRRLCDRAQLDWDATRQRADIQRLITAAEAQRLSHALHWMQEDASGRRVQREELHSLSEELSNNYEELSLIYKLSHSMTLNQPAEEFFREACAELHEVSSLNWIGLEIVGNQPRLKELQGQSYLAGRPGAPGEAERLGPRLVLDYADLREPAIIDDTTSLCPELSAHDKSLLIVPLRRDGVLLGMLFGGGRRDGEYLTSIDAKLCASISNNLAIFLENFMLFEDAQTLFLGTLHALTRAIDAKDSYTFGHSERVAALSKTLARAADLDEATAERIYLSGLVHDVGKIGVPEAVLCKAGRLTDQEFESIKMHPAIGAGIIRDIRQMEDLIPGVLHHHERWDGRGYPHRLTGLDIPLFGRVIGLADAFDAMSSNRTYRSALEHPRVLEEIRLNRGTQFDPELADVFLNLDFEPYFDMIRRHRAEKGLGSA
ncbi:MAG: HD-GYP domain-containing protein [Planctomycetota bacterium]